MICKALNAKHYQLFQSTHRLRTESSQTSAAFLLQPAVRDRYFRLSKSPDTTMYNLAISHDEDAWRKPQGFHDFSIDRVAIEYTTNALQEKYKGRLQALTENPCLFAYEHGRTDPA